MRIKYNEFVANPTLRHTTVNLPAHVCQSLIAQGVATHVAYTSVKDRIESEASLLPKPKPPVVEWGIQQASSEYSRTAIIRRDANGCTYYGSPTPDTPPSIAEQFRQLTDGVEPAQYSPDEAKMLEAAHSVGDSNKRRLVVIGHDKAGKPITRDPGEFVSRK